MGLMVAVPITVVIKSYSNISRDYTFIILLSAAEEKMLFETCLTYAM